MRYRARFEPPPGDFERFARRFSSRDLSEVKAARRLRSGVTARNNSPRRKLPRYFQEHRDEKILVFLRRDAAGPGSRRSLLRRPKNESAAVDSQSATPLGNPGRVYWRGTEGGSGRRGIARRFEIVNRAPVARRRRGPIPVPTVACSRRSSSSRRGPRTGNGRGNRAASSFQFGAPSIRACNLSFGRPRNRIPGSKDGPDNRAPSFVPGEERDDPRSGNRRNARPPAVS